MSSGDTVPTVAEVDRIRALADPVVRNLQITQCYYGLSRALTAFSGPTANWCTFATWASKQAGQTMRHEDLARTFVDRLGVSPYTTIALERVLAWLSYLGVPRRVPGLYGALCTVVQPSTAFVQAAAAVARGNCTVFAEIGREFARFLALCPSGRVPDPETIAGFCATLRPGDPPEGQRYLQLAFRSYGEAFRASTPQARAEWMLLANLAIGCHEQTRLQPEIAAALAAPVPNVQRSLLHLLTLLAPYLGVVRRFVVTRLFAWPTPLRRAWGAFTTVAAELAQRVITECLMTLRLPERTLRLGRDVPAACPAHLQHGTLPALQHLLAQIDPTPDSTRGSGTGDWADLRNRIHCIADFFRAYQDNPLLLSAPFTAQQVALLNAGHIPSGPL